MLRYVHEPQKSHNEMISTTDKLYKNISDLSAEKCITGNIK